MRSAVLRGWLAALIAALTPAFVVRARRDRQDRHREAVRLKARQSL